MNHPLPLQKSLILTIFLKNEVWYFIDEDNAQQSKALNGNHYL
ncbi:hypothetical protein MICAF_6190002 [Microcystis aeruginosa PCC 9807]|uniref:Uncharacterized protein n=1 Tax=Microcystis aeruginosa PCC 9807 TaxID=1160283 RepID=I4HDN3_MICAE|nr:hypothetical protein MICAF_6190002 [Microcystis aeruginosa PCC 9807]